MGKGVGKGQGKKVKIISPETEKEIQQLKIKVWTTTQAAYVWRFYGLQVVAGVFTIIGMLTEHWYGYEKSEKLTTIAGNRADFSQKWTMGISQISVTTEFCLMGDCNIDKDQTLRFDGQGSFKFPSSYDGVRSELNSGREILEAAIITQLVGILLCSCCMWVGYYLLHNKTPSFRKLRWTTLAACVLSILSTLLGLWGVSMFAVGSKPFREHLKTNSWVAYTKPEMFTLGWSAWMVIIGVSLSGAGLILTLLSYFFIKSGVDVEPEIIAERNARVRAYFNDLANTTHMTEVVSMDTAQRHARSPGWTTEVRTKTTNIPTDKNWRDDVQVEDLDVEAPIMGSLAPPPPGVITKKYEVQPSNKSITEKVQLGRQKVIQELDEEGNPLVFAERKRQVTRAPKPMKRNVYGPVDSPV